MPGAPARLALNDGRSLSADAVVLAIRAPRRRNARVVGPRLRSGAGRRRRRQGRGGSMGARRARDPWCASAHECLGDRFGTHRRRRRAASHGARRHGHAAVASRRAPAPISRHRPADELPNLDELAAEVSLEQLRTALAADFAHARDAGSDWRQVIDALRPHTSRLWRSLRWEDQRRFLREDLRDWEVLRHRMPPTVADAIQAAIDSGQLIIEAGEVADVAARQRRGTGCDDHRRVGASTRRRGGRRYGHRVGSAVADGRRSGRTCWRRTSHRCTRAASAFDSIRTATSSTRPGARPEHRVSRVDPTG